MDGLAPIIIQGSFAVSILGFMWKVATDSNRKTEVIFRRFDEYKEEVKKDFVSKEGCGIRHDNLTRDIQEIKTDVKILLRSVGIEYKPK
jgi:hypothetical protein